ncbi:MAG TPA: response regulator transcription factor [Thermomicrobiales bacterium]|nr:response regulator transcription factor [Thermomicrobiales bacterium]
MTPASPEEPKASILVVEDDNAILQLVMTTLRFTGYRATGVATGREALAVIRNESFDLLLLDVNLPDIDGFSICSRLRSGGDITPVIFLTARDDPDDLRTGFTGGGDDYITKPFSLEELLLRTEAVLRRSRPQDTTTSQLICGDLTLDEAAFRVWRGNEEIFLSPTEFRLLRYLMLNQDRVLSKQQILEHVWDYGYAGEPTAVETYISYLRRKLDDRDTQLIHTVRGFGYSLRSPDHQPSRS